MKSKFEYPKRTICERLFKQLWRLDHCGGWHEGNAKRRRDLAVESEAKDLMCGFSVEAFAFHSVDMGENQVDRDLGKAVE